MILSDSEIMRRINAGEITIESPNQIDFTTHLWPASFDFTLGNTFKRYKLYKTLCIDPKEPLDESHLHTTEIADGDYFILHPGQFILWSTKEVIWLPDSLMASIEGRSSLARLGIIIHSTAGFINPWFKGTITLEITNINSVPIKIYPGMRFGHWAFWEVTGEVNRPYGLRPGSKYQDQSLPEASRITSEL
jgi:dCTP deaminase